MEYNNVGLVVPHFLRHNLCVKADVTGPPPHIQPQQGGSNCLAAVTPLFYMMWWSGTVLHLYWAQSELMPADTNSCVSQATPVQITDSSVQAREQWNI